MPRAATSTASTAGLVFIPADFVSSSEGVQSGLVWVASSVKFISGVRDPHTLFLVNVGRFDNGSSKGYMSRRSLLVHCELHPAGARAAHPPNDLPRVQVSAEAAALWKEQAGRASRH
jgi:hypothetical protein